MKIGIVGSSTMTEPYMGIEVSFPEDAARFLEMIRAAWGGNPQADITSPPVAVLDSAGHGVGESIGLVFENSQRNLKYREPGPIFNLTSRLSYGSDQDFRRRTGVPSDVINEWIPDSSERLHISLSCFREITSPDISHIYHEGMLFSLRWIDGRFDDWSDPSIYGAEKKRVHPTRTTHTHSMQSSIVSAGFVDLHGNTPRILDDRGVMIGYDRETHSMDDLQHSDMIGRAGGYEHALTVLAEFGDVDLEGTVNDLTPMEGVEFLLGKVLPAMTAFGKGNYSNG